jgi:two-component system OmpR family sensor kinase
MTTVRRYSKWGSLELVAGIAHDLKTPLATIATSADLLEQDLDPSSYNHLIDIIQRQAQRLQAMIQDLSDFLSIESGTVNLHPAVADLTELVRDTCRDFQEFTADHTLDLRLPASAVLMRADSTKIHRILENLLSNAVKYSPKGTQISCTLGLDESSGAAIITIEDEGPGIVPEMRERVFEPFVRVGVQTNPGQGLGLYVVKLLAEAHAGSVWIESGTSGGARVRVMLPLLGRPVESGVARRGKPGRSVALRELARE